MNRKTSIYLSLILIATGSLIVTNLLYEAEEISAANENKVTEVDFHSEIQDDAITVQKGQKVTVPVKIVSSAEKPIDIRMYVSGPEEARLAGLKSELKTPNGIDLSLSKATVSKPAESGSGITVRDTIPLTISVSENAEDGIHTLAFTSVHEKGNGRASIVTEYFRVNVVP